MPAAVESIDLELDETQEQTLCNYLQTQLSAALEAHRQRETKYAEWKRAYKAKPEHETKNFPWPGASNVVIPIVGITVDTIVARLMRAFLGTKDLVEVEILDPQYETMKKDFRDWAKMFFSKAGARDRLRTAFHDMTLDGTAYLKNVWVSDSRIVHSYGDQGGQITSTEVVDYEGPQWQSIAAADMVFPTGYDDWGNLPWIAQRLRLNWSELIDSRTKGMYTFENDFKNQCEDRNELGFRVVQETTKVQAGGPLDLYYLYEIWGKIEIPNVDTEAEPEFAEVILTYSLRANKLLRKIHNPFFGTARHIKRIPFLHQPHEIEGMGAAEQVKQFQDEASTAHNQVIDAATAAIAGIVVKKPSSDMKDGDQIYPGKTITTDEPMKDVNVIHLSMGNSTLPGTEQAAAYWGEKRSGVSSYNMGVESGVAGSRATATGTTAIISEGNMRFWVSIDDMRDAIVELLYLTLQMEQQMRPDGIPISQNRMLVLPQGDLRSILGLKLHVSSEKINRDLEIQNFQVLITILNDYYARVMQAGAVVMNPAFPPGQKLLIVQVMNAASNIVKRLVERFDIENIDEVVPGLTQAIQMIGGMLGPAAMAPDPRLAAGPGPQRPPGGAGQPPQRVQ